MNRTEDQWLKVKNTPETDFACISYEELLESVNSWDLVNKDSVLVKLYSADCTQVTESTYDSLDEASDYLETIDLDVCDVIVMDQKAMTTSLNFNED